MAQISKNYPTDATGDTLRRIEQSGSNLEKEMLVEFFLEVPELHLVPKLQAFLNPHCLEQDLDYDDELGIYTLTITKQMVATYDLITSYERLLQSTSAQFGSNYVGFGSFGE